MAISNFLGYAVGGFANDFQQAGGARFKNRSPSRSWRDFPWQISTASLE
jgi:hypothetical protein